MPWDWILLVLFLLFLLYAAFAIKSEKNNYENWGVNKTFHDLSLLVPNWWTETEQSETHLKFERTDTRYDWFARVEKKKCSLETSIDKVLDDEIKRMELEFDEGPMVQRDDSDLILDPETRAILNNGFKRVESTATQFGTERVYMDVAVIKLTEQPYYYLLYNWSSVLNGMVEGPYFEEVIKNIKLTTQPS